MRGIYGKMQRSRLVYGATSALAMGAASLAAVPAMAQDEAEPAASREEARDDIIVTGSRFGARSAIDSSTPVDLVSADDLAKTGDIDIKNALRTTVPSFGISRSAASGALDFLQTPTLRGLSSGQLLVLLNGKRRHTSSTLNLGSVTGRGDVSYDFNAIPQLALDRVEVLRDGAAAQYGSDAIAGVVNLMLASGTDFKGQVRYGQTDRGDGEDFSGGLSGGLPIGDGGSIRLTAQYQNHKKTNRAQIDTRQQYFGVGAGGSPTLPSGNFGSGTGLTPSNGALDPREAAYDRNNFVFGDPAYESWQLFGNAIVPLGDVEAYAFGGISELDGRSFNFFRRAGQDETVRALYPDGYLPLQDVLFKNRSIAAGLRGTTGAFAWDLSSTYGTSRENLYYLNTNNVSLGLNSPASFYRGSTGFRQWTNNLDVSREFDLGAEAPLSIAFGLEYRKEFYDIAAGEPASYVNGGVPIIGGPNNGRPAPVGAQPGGGITPAEEVSRSRNSKAFYLEAQQKLFDRLTLEAALRYEDFSDFGDTWNYKFAGRLEILDGWAIRASYGSGFRAPALAQSFFSSTNILFVNGNPVRQRHLALSDPAAPLVGAVPLKPEKSKNLSVGTTLSIGRLNATFDYYRIAIDDRIAASSIFQSTALTNLLAANGYPGLGGLSYLTNAVDTTTRGFDATATYKQPLGSLGDLKLIVGYNHNSTRLDRIAGTPPALAALGITTPLFDLTQQVRYKNSTPKDSASLTIDWTLDRFNLSVTNTLYGKVSQVALTGRTPAQVAALIPGYNVTLVPSAPGSVNSDIVQHFRSDIITDLQLSYRFGENVTVAAGASNIFDTYPGEVIRSNAASVAAGTNGSDNAGTLPYAIIAPYGFNGRSFYGRISFQF